MSFFPFVKKDINSEIDVHREIERWVDLYENGILRLPQMYVKFLQKACDFRRNSMLLIFIFEF